MSTLTMLASALAVASVSRAAEPVPPKAPAAPVEIPRNTQPNQAAPGSAKQGLANQPLPNTAGERTKLLQNLYAYLATAEDDKQAQPITQAIERLWLYSGSDTVTLLMDRSAKAIGDKNLDLALKFLDAVVDLAPDYAEGWNRRAYVHHLRNDVERMVGDLRRCIALEPNHYRAMEFLGLILRETGQKKAALKAFERLLEINPNAPGVPDAVNELSRDVDGQKT
ncbi:MAG: tetratricopeptide repeat protein [Hyphomicrobiaceae bacterium]